VNLRFGPLSDRTVHLCVDMQNLFALGTPWHTPWMARVLPVVTGIAQEHPRDTIFTRFIPPERPGQMPGTGQRYYERWRDLTLERIDPHWLDLAAPLAALTPAAEIVDKRFYSPFSEPRLPDLLHRRGTDALVITGAETDVCVLAAVLDAVDLGYRVVLVTDALCSSSDATHDALLTLYRNPSASRSKQLPARLCRPAGTAVNPSEDAREDMQQKARDLTLPRQADPYRRRRRFVRGASLQAAA
jgi:nicotinamidase-related amidase